MLIQCFLVNGVSLAGSFLDNLFWAVALGLVGWVDYGVGATVFSLVGLVSFGFCSVDCVCLVVMFEGALELRILRGVEG